MILDLSRVNTASPADLFRGVFQSSEALYEEVDTNFDKVILAREGKLVFFIEGGDFSTLGAEFKNRRKMQTKQHGNGASELSLQLLL